MFVDKLCSPAVLYLGFSLTQIIIDLFKKMYNTAIVKMAVMIVFTTVLNLLCARGLTTISWFIVFIPFVTMSLVTGILMYLFGLAPFTGKLDYSQLANGKDITTPPPNPAINRGIGPKEPSPNEQPVTTQPIDYGKHKDTKTDGNPKDTQTKPSDDKPKSIPSNTEAKTSGETALINSKSKENVEKFTILNQSIEAFGNYRFMT